MRARGQLQLPDKLLRPILLLLLPPPISVPLAELTEEGLEEATRGGEPLLELHQLDLAIRELPLRRVELPEQSAGVTVERAGGYSAGAEIDGDQIGRHHEKQDLELASKVDRKPLLRLLLASHSRNPATIREEIAGVNIIKTKALFASDIINDRS